MQWLSSWLYAGDLKSKSTTPSKVASVYAWSAKCGEERIYGMNYVIIQWSDFAWKGIKAGCNWSISQPKGDVMVQK